MEYCHLPDGRSFGAVGTKRYNRLYKIQCMFSCLLQGIENYVMETNVEGKKYSIIFWYTAINNFGPQERRLVRWNIPVSIIVTVLANFLKLPLCNWSINLRRNIYCFRYFLHRYAEHFTTKHLGPMQRCTPTVWEATQALRIDVEIRSLNMGNKNYLNTYFLLSSDVKRTD